MRARSFNNEADFMKSPHVVRLESHADCDWDDASRRDAEISHLDEKRLFARTDLESDSPLKTEVVRTEICEGLIRVSGQVGGAAAKSIWRPPRCRIVETADDAETARHQSRPRVHVGAESGIDSAPAAVAVPHIYPVVHDVGSQCEP